MRPRRGRRLVGAITLLALVVIAVGVTGVELPLPGGGNGQVTRLLPGVRALAASVLVRNGSSAPPGSRFAFFAVEPSGNLLVSDAGRHSVLRFDASGQLLSEWGPRLGGVTLEEPAGVAVQGDRYYVLDRGTPRLVRLDASGQLQATLSLESLAPYGLNGLAVDPNGNLYAADTGRNRLLVFTPDGGLLRTLGRAGTDLGAFTQPMALAFAINGGLFVADWENSRIERFNPALEATDAWPTGFRPFGVAVDRLGRVFVPDADRRRVVAYTGNGAVLGEIGLAAPVLEVVPRQVAIGRGDVPTVYVLGSEGIQRLDLENTPPPPQGASADVDVVSWLVIALLGAVLVLAYGSRRARRRALLQPAPDGPVRVDAENGRQRQNEQAAANQKFLVANQAKSKQ